MCACTAWLLKLVLWIYWFKVLKERILLQLPERTLPVSGVGPATSSSLLINFCTSLSASLSLWTSSYSRRKASSCCGIFSLVLPHSLSVLIVFKINDVDLKLCALLESANRTFWNKLSSWWFVGDGVKSIVIFVVVVVVFELSRFVVVFEHTVCFDLESSRPMRTTRPFFNTCFFTSVTLHSFRFILLYSWVG